MTAILKTSVVQNASSSTANITLDTSGGVSIGDGVIATPSTMSLQSNGSTTALYIDTSQNVGIGTSSPGVKLDVNGAIKTSSTLNIYYSGKSGLLINEDSSSNVYINQQDNGPMIFNTNNTERMRIDTSGNLLVGTTTSNYGKIEVDINISGSGGAARFINNGTSGYTGELVQMITGQGASTAYNILSCYYSGGGAYAFRVRGDGTLFAQNTTIQSASDQRLKENIVDATDGLNIVTALKPRRFDWKDGQGNGKKNQLGFIAQEIEQVFPEATDIWGPSGDPANPYKSIGTNALIPVLVKAIQELAAEVNALKAKVGA